MNQTLFGGLLVSVGLALPVALRAQLVAPPTFTYISVPSSATLGQTISIGAGGQGNASDNSDGNNWNSGDQMDILRITIDICPPGGSWTNLYDWLPVWETPASATVSYTLNQTGTWYVSFQLMDGRPWYSNQLVYAITVNPPPSPQITSSLSVTADQGQSISYQITASNSPTSYSASNLPSGLSLNTSTGVISGALPTNNGAQSSNQTIQSTISASNAQGTGSATVTWNIAAAQVIPAASINLSAIYFGQSVTLTRNGTCNFGLGWTENVIWPPTGSAQVLGDMGYGSMSYTPNSGTGTYWYQYRLVDVYYNYMDQWISFTVTGVVTAPTSLQATSVGTTSVTLGWGGSTATNGVNYYNIYRNGALIGTASGTTYTDNTAQASTTYTYAVQAVENSDNASSGLTSMTVTTLGDFELFTPLP